MPFNLNYISQGLKVKFMEHFKTFLKNFIVLPISMHYIILWKCQEYINVVYNFVPLLKNYFIILEYSELYLIKIFQKKRFAAMLNPP